MADVGDYVWLGWCDATNTSTNITIDSAWDYWIDEGTTATAVTATSSDTAWRVWTSTGTTTDVCETWISWTTDDGTTAGTNLRPQTVRAIDVRTPEQIAADDARRQAERERIAARAAQAAEERRRACERAHALLVAMLDVKQREQYERDRFFEVISRHSKRRYRVRQGTHGNVRLLDEHGAEVVRYCAQPLGVPDEDAMLAQKLMLEHEEDSFLRVANQTRLQPARAVA